MRVITVSSDIPERPEPYIVINISGYNHTSLLNDVKFTVEEAIDLRNGIDDALQDIELEG